MYRSFFPRDVVAELDRLQRDVQQAFDLSPTIRGIGRNGFPALNVGGTAQAIEIYAFAPGVDPGSLEVHLERGLLTIAGRRKSVLAQHGEKAAIHINERFEGDFRRTLSMPEDADPEGVEAALRDGVLHITVRRKASAQPRRISIH
jgi:HSP20 family protein